MKRVRLASGIGLAVVDVGPREAPALLFLHGFPENHRTWRHQVAHFSDRFRCVAPDQRGYGESGKPPRVGDYKVRKLVRDVFQLADALGLRRFTVVGHDWGGALAWIVAAFGQLTGRVTHAVIANAPHPALFQRLLWTDPAQRQASHYIRTFRDPANDALVREHGLAALLLKAFGEERLSAIPPNDERALLLEQWADPATAFAMLNWYRASPVRVPPDDAPYRMAWPRRPLLLPKLRIPTLVVWGMEDVALVPANIDGLERRVSNLTLERIERCGHFVPWEAPDAVIRAMEGFLPTGGHAKGRLSHLES
jgi:pimeloyl-ACP methyl ester carboxylesterase